MANLPTSTALRGLALPATPGPGGYFESKTALDVAWGDLMVALFVPRGTRVMKRTFGSVLREQLFEPNDDAQASLLDYVIREAAQDHCPHLEIRNVEATASEDGVRGVKVRVTFALRTDIGNLQKGEVLVTKTHISTGAVG